MATSKSSTCGSSPGGSHSSSACSELDRTNQPSNCQSDCTEHAGFCFSLMGKCRSEPKTPFIPGPPRADLHANHSTREEDQCTETQEMGTMNTPDAAFTDWHPILFLSPHVFLQFFLNNFHHLLQKY